MNLGIQYKYKLYTAMIIIDIIIGYFNGLLMTHRLDIFMFGRN